MKRTIIYFWICSVLFLGGGYGTELYLPPLAPKINPNLSQKLTQNPNEGITVWVFFTDKGIRTEGEYMRALESLQNLPYRGDFQDLPLYEGYIQKIEELGGRLRVRSEWLNGASFTLSKRMVNQVEGLPCVREIREVARTRKDILIPERKKDGKMKIEKGVEKETDPALLAFEEIDYGDSYKQVAMLKIPEAHRMGFFGEEVTIGVLDTGFELDTLDYENIHISLRHLRKQNRIKGEHDFNTGDALYFRRSSNQGGNWTPEDSPPNSFSALIAHHDLSGSSGEIHWVFDGDISLNDPSPDPGRADVFHIFSTNGGVTWSGPDTLTSGISMFSIFPKVSAGDTTFVVWQNDSAGVPEIFLSYSPFSTPVNVSNDLSPSYTPDVVKGGSFIHVVWSDDFSSILYSRSTDPSSWGSPITLSSTSIGELVNPRIATLDSSVHVVWEFSDTLPSFSSQVYYRKSPNEGVSWDSLDTLASNGGSPTIEVDPQGNLHLLYIDESQFPLMNLGYRISTDTGSTWSPPDSILTTPKPYIDGISLTILDTIVFVVFKQADTIFTSSLNGNTWSSPQTLSTSIWDRNPLIASDGSNLLTSWTRRGDDDVSFDPLSWDSLYYDPYQPPNNIGGHGTWMLSIMAGLSQFNLIGPAFASNFLLAKTERAGYENPVEEDWWVDGIEWFASQGAEIISSSIAYTTWGTGDWYDYSDMDGRTAITSRAASLALKKGVLIVNAISNVSKSDDPDPDVDPDSTIAAPSDAFDIIAVGGVDSLGQWYGSMNNFYSAKGPTADGRTKPELVAPFRQWMVDLGGINPYVERAGTSGATALVAGLAAVVKSAHPSWSAVQLRDALLQTASNTSSPNDTVGWGIPDAIKAIGTPEIPAYEEDQLLDPYPNPFRPAIHDTCVLPYRLLENPVSFPVIRIYTLSGELIKEFELNEKIPGRWYFTSWNGRNEKDEEVAGGLYICVLSTGSRTERKKIALVR